jgi:hypothetical protein
VEANTATTPIIIAMLKIINNGNQRNWLRLAEGRTRGRGDVNRFIWNSFGLWTSSEIGA